MGEGSLAHDAKPLEEPQGLHLLEPRELHRVEDPRLPQHREEPNGLFDHTNSDF